MIKLKFGEYTIEFNRVVGGWAWPSDQPGFFVAVAEKIIPRADGDIIQYYVIDETADINIDKLIPRAIEIRNRMEIQGVFGRPRRTGFKTLPAMHFLEQWNLSSGLKGGPTFHLAEAPYLEERGLISFHTNLLRSLTMPDKKRLFFGKSGIATTLLQVPEDQNLALDTNYPSVAALGYAVANLDSTQEIHKEALEAEIMAEELWGGDF